MEKAISHTSLYLSLNEFQVILHTQLCMCLFGLLSSHTLCRCRTGSGEIVKFCVYILVQFRPWDTEVERDVFELNPCDCQFYCISFLLFFLFFSFLFYSFILFYLHFKCYTLSRVPSCKPPIISLLPIVSMRVLPYPLTHSHLTTLASFLCCVTSLYRIKGLLSQ